MCLLVPEITTSWAEGGWLGGWEGEKWGCLFLYLSSLLTSKFSADSEWLVTVYFFVFLGGTVKQKVKISMQFFQFFAIYFLNTAIVVLNMLSLHIMTNKNLTFKKNTC